MARPTLNRLLDRVWAISGQRDGVESDRELLRRFLSSRDEAAFSALVRRHGHVVVAACRQVLSESADIDDAFQATFLILLRRAKSVNWHESLASWLYAVAHRVAVRARAQAEFRHLRETSAGKQRSRSVEPADLSWREACAILHEELDKLPAQYRKVLLLCYLEGQSRDEAARNLGCSRGVVKGNLERGRQLLGRRLARRGVTLSAGLLAEATGARKAAAMSAPAALIESTCVAARGNVSPSVSALVAGAVPAASAGKRILVGLLLLIGVLGASVAFGWPHATEDQPPAADKTENPTPKPAPAAKPAIAETPETPPEVESTIAGQVVDPDGKPVGGGKVYWVAWGHSFLKPQHRATTGRDGRFSFKFRHPAWTQHPSIEDFPGNYGYPVVITDGFGPGWTYQSRDFSNLKIITTPDTIPLHGRVIDLEGRPIAGVKISACTLAAAGDWKDLSPWIESNRNPKQNASDVYLNTFHDQMGIAAGGLLPSTVSDKEGKFELRGLGRDRVVTIRIEGDHVETQQLEVLTRATDRFTVREVARTHTYYGCPCTLVAAPSTPIIGVVKDKDTGKPIAGATIIPWSFGIDSHGRAILDLTYTSDSEGRYRITGFPRNRKPFLPAIVASRPGDEPYPWSMRQSPPTDGSDPIKFDIELKRGISLTIKAVDKQTGKPVSAVCEYYPHKDNAYVREYPFFWGTNPNPLVIKSATETRRTAIPGRGVVTAEVWDSKYLIGVVPASLADSVNGTQFSTAGAGLSVNNFNAAMEVSIEPGAKSAEVTIALDPGLSLIGNVLDPKGNELAGSLCLGLHPRSSYIDRVPMSSAQFEVFGLRADEKRRVIVFHKEKKLAGSVIVTGGQKEPASVRLKPWGEVTGRLVDETGKVVKDGMHATFSEGACYKDLSLGASPLCPTNTYREVGPDGRFRFSGLAPGLKYHFVLYRSMGRKSGPETPLDVAVKPGEVKDLGDIVVRAEAKE